MISVVNVRTINILDIKYLPGIVTIVQLVNPQLRQLQVLSLSHHEERLHAEKKVTKNYIKTLLLSKQKIMNTVKVMHQCKHLQIMFSAVDFRTSFLLPTVHAI